MAGTYDVQIRSVPADRAAKDAVPLSQVVLQHHRTDGIQIEAQPLSGGHLLHLAVAGCIFNDLYHLAAERGIRLTDVRVAATGDFEGEEPTVSTGVTYQVAVSGEASEEQLRELVSEVDRIASIPDVLRRPTAVSLSDVKIDATR
jgi:putative redox protein